MVNKYYLRLKVGSNKEEQYHREQFHRTPCTCVRRANNAGILYIEYRPLCNCTYAVDVLNLRGHLFVLDEEVVTSRHVLHDVPLDLLVLQHGQAVIHQDRRQRGVEVGPVGGETESATGLEARTHRMSLTQETRGLGNGGGVWSCRTTSEHGGSVGSKK